MSITLTELTFKKADVGDLHATGIFRALIELSDATAHVIATGAAGFQDNIPPVISLASILDSTADAPGEACWLNSTAGEIIVQAPKQGVNSAYNYSLLGIGY